MKSNGTKFGITVDNRVSYIYATKVMDMTPPEKTRETNEESFLDSVEDVKEFTTGMLDPGEFSATVVWNADDPLHIAINDSIDNGNIIDCKILYPDNSSQLFKGLVTKVGKSVAKGESISTPFSIKISGMVEEVSP